MKKNKFYNKEFSLKILCLIFICLLIVKSRFTPLTYDEAYTYLNYVITKDYFNIGLANNHLLNTVLIGLTTLYDNSEFFIRLPSIFSGILYVFVAFKFSEKYKHSYLILIIFLFNPLLFEFFSLARGYSISASLNLLSIYLYIYSKYKYKYPLVIFLLWISSLAIFINLITLFLIILLNYFLEKDAIKNTYTNFVNLIFIILSWPIVNWVFEITKENKPLYGNEIEIPFIEHVITIFGFVKTYFVKSLSLGLVFILFTLFTYYKFYSVNKIRKFSTALFFLTLLSLIAIPIIFSKPFPVNRVLIPFMPIFQIFLVSIFGELERGSFSNFLISLLFFNFIFTYNLNESLVWGKSIELTEEGNSEYCASLLISRPEIQYYLEYREFC